METHAHTDHKDFGIAKTSQVIWFIAHFISILLGLRFLFLALGANITGVVAMIYNTSTIFVYPFKDIFPSPQTGQFFFDTAALLGILMYYLLAFLLIRALLLFSKKTTPPIEAI
jgi:hypothetical protein